MWLFILFELNSFKSNITNLLKRFSVLKLKMAIAIIFVDNSSKSFFWYLFFNEVSDYRSNIKHLQSITMLNITIVITKKPFRT